MKNTESGYSGKILRVDLSSQQMSETPTAVYAEFVGGRGIAAKVYWDEVPAGAKAYDPENRLIFVTGPLTGFAGFGSSRWQVCGKSPATEPEEFCWCNMGGTWGVALKFAGYDGVVVHGKADRPVYLLVDGNGAQVRDAAHLWGKGAIDTREMLRSERGQSSSVVACGQAGENLVVGATLLADKDASGGGGFGAVMGSKKLKAIVVAKGSRRPVAAHPGRIPGLVKHFHWLLGDRYKILSFFDKYLYLDPEKTGSDHCWGCPGPCLRKKWKAEDGTEGKFACQSAMVYQGRATKYYGKETDVPLKVTRLCDNYGIDTMYLNPVMVWLSKCFRNSIISETETGIPLSKEGSLEYAESLLRKIAFREGIGDLLADGVATTARAVGKGAEAQMGDVIHKAHVEDIYSPRIYLVNSLLYAMDPRRPMQQLHEASILVEQWLDRLHGVEGSYVTGEVFRAAASRFFGSEAAADFTSYEGKALAAKKIQDREYAKECLILCDMQWPVMTSPNTEDHVGDPSLEAMFLSAITGKETDEAGLNRVGERVFSIQRAAMARDGHLGRPGDSLPEFCFNAPLKFQYMNPECLVPGLGGEPVSRKGAVVDRRKFEAMKDEYYRLRGWDVATGRQTRASLEHLGLRDVADELEKKGLLGGKGQSVTASTEEK